MVHHLSMKTTASGKLFQYLLLFLAAIKKSNEFCSLETVNTKAFFGDLLESCKRVNQWRGIQLIINQII